MHAGRMGFVLVHTGGLVILLGRGRRSLSSSWLMMVGVCPFGVGTLYSMNVVSGGADRVTVCCVLLGTFWRVNFLSLSACTLRRWVSLFVLISFALVRPPRLVRVDRRVGVIVFLLCRGLARGCVDVLVLRSSSLA